jgi:hypothetical protein
MCVRKCHVIVDMCIKSYGMPHALDLEVLNQPLGIEFDPPKSVASGFGQPPKQKVRVI